ncbi:hypothetical protein ACFY2M_41390 [Streptomyces sp. NPDC001276]|uniref:Mu transposase domain-containing protein n=1 Tax=Streptomyces sp. NPDC001276 TaxID=3364555 RepID=UPI0036A046A3
MTTVGELAAAESLLDIPVRPFRAELEVERTVSPQGLVQFDGNFYSVPPGLPGVQVKVLHRPGEDDLRIVTAGRAVIAQHRRAPRGAGQTVRDDGHVIALERAVLASFSDRAPCKNKVRKPLSEAALAEAERLRGQTAAGHPAERVVIVSGRLPHSSVAVSPRSTPWDRGARAIRWTRSRNSPAVTQRSWCKRISRPESLANASRFSSTYVRKVWVTVDMLDSSWRATRGPASRLGIDLVANRRVGRWPGPTPAPSHRRCR